VEQVKASIERYLSAPETADRQEGEVAEARSARQKDKIALLREQMRKYRALEVAVHAAPDKQISLTDPDARSMATTGKDTGLVGYNVQAVVDAPASPDRRARGHQFKNDHIAE
jgi:transposase